MMVASRAEHSAGPLCNASLRTLTQVLVQMVVVYKIDRLTRSLADFAKMVERFDAAGCSFVSVTQAFNTASSMGRLTLNVLLSFAQFERVVTAERIRDKIAASEKKGLWMGGYHRSATIRILIRRSAVSSLTPTKLKQCGRSLRSTMISAA